MNRKNYSVAFILITALMILLGACEKDYNAVIKPPPPPPPPKVAMQTTTLEAWYTSTPITDYKANFWKTANYLVVSAKDVSTGLLYGDGLLNMTGTYTGLTQFSKGGDPKLIMKAAYDANNIYILAEWYDSTVNLAQGSWLYNGNPDPLKSSESSSGWTSQNNSDKFALAFEINSASNGTNTFSSDGCKACCHGTGISTVMSPTTGTVDIWNWSLATSAPIGFAHDMFADATGLKNDLGQLLAARNNIGNTDRSGLAFEADSASQSVTLPNGAVAILDKAFYILENNKIQIKGDASVGYTIYHNSPADCNQCHGDNGVGSPNTGFRNDLNQNRKSLQKYKDAMNDISDMDPYWDPLSEQKKDDLVAYLRGLAGVPGYYLNPNATGSTTDVKAVNNVSPTQIMNAIFTSSNKHTVKYQVLITRKLKTNNSDDIQFDAAPNKTYNFGVAMMDNDGKNHIGSFKEVLTFK